METLARRLKALADPTRLRIVRLLHHGELCICDVTAAVDLPQSTVSRHMAYLKNAGWVSGRRKGKWVYYTLAVSGDPVLARIAQAVRDGLAGAARTAQDEARLAAHRAAKGAAACDETPNP
jgi:ArsR family transcriptional regulator